jgi:hypothetical protein
MFDKLKTEWWEFKTAQSGHRFVECYERHQKRESPWLKPVLFFAAVFSLVVGVVLAFVPGPAILFFAIAGALLACESRTVAMAFDKVESWGRSKFSRLRAPRRKRDARATTKALSPQAAAVIAARAEKAQKQQREVTRQAVEQPAARRHAEMPERDPAEGPAPEAGAPPVDMSSLQVPGSEPSEQPGAAPSEQPTTARSEQSIAEPSERHATAQPVDMSKLYVPFEAAEYARGMEERDETSPQKPMAESQDTPIATVHTFPMPKMRKPVRVIATQEIGTRVDAPRTQPQQRRPMPRVAGTVQLWTADMPKPQLSATQDATPQPERRTTPKPAIVTLPPPKMVGERPKRASTKSALTPIGDRRAAPPPPPRGEEHRRSRA